MYLLHEVYRLQSALIKSNPALPRLIVMCWCVNKFGRKLIAPDTVTNNELADFLSRVPNDEMIQVV